MSKQQTWRFPIILGISVVFGLPALTDLMLQPDQLLRAGMSYLGALGLSWLGVNAIFTLVEHYTRHNHHLRRQREMQEVADALLTDRDDREDGDARSGADPRAAQPEPAMAATNRGRGAGSSDGGADPSAPRRPVARDLLMEEAEAGAVI